MVDLEFVLPWIEKAENDFSAARYLAENMYPPPIEIVCFHCQQAAEKYSKAFLVLNDKEPPRTHDLIELAKLCSNLNSDFTLLLPKCEYLLPFATRMRYPGTSDPNYDDVKRALNYAQEIIEFAKSRMQLPA